MGLNNEGSARVVFDIETAPLPEAAEYLEPAEAPGNYKDPAKIAAFVAEKNAENLDRCGLDVDLCRVVALGWQVEGSETLAATIEQFHGDESLMLRSFWNLAADKHLVGFNCLAFDLPVLMRRSQYLGVLTPYLQIDKYKHPQVTDLMRVLDFNGAIKSRGLSFYAKRFGIPSDDTLTGADIAQAVTEGRWADIAKHVTADVQKTAALAAKLGFFRMAEAAVF